MQKVFKCLKFLHTPRYTRGISSQKNVDLFFQNLGKCDLLSTTSDKPSSINHTPEMGTLGEQRGSLKNEGELTRQVYLRKKIKESEDELRILSEALHSHNQAKIMAAIKPSLSGKMYMSSGELIQEGSPQYLESFSDTTSEDITPGRTTYDASVSMIGSVCTDPEIRGKEDDSFAEFLVSYKCPSVFSPKTTKEKDTLNFTTAYIRCYGETLRLFAVQSVHSGDLIHVLGMLLPPSTGGKHSNNVIGVFPTGGNISVVVPSE